MEKKFSRDFSRIRVRHVSRRKSSKRQRSKKRHTAEDLKTSQSNIIRDRPSVQHPRLSNVSVSRSVLISKATPAISNSKQHKIMNEGHGDSIFAQTKEETDQSKGVDRPRHSLLLNSITHSTTCFDLSLSHRSLNRNHRISPIHCSEFSKGELTLDVIDRYVRC